MSFASFLADATAVREYGDYLVEAYLTDANGATSIQRWSRHGTGIGSTAITTPEGDSIAAHTPFRKRLLTAPTLSQSLWQQGQIGGESMPSFGGVSLRNRDGGLDALKPARGYKWADRRMKVFFCDRRPQNIASTIGKVFDGKMGHPRFSLSQIDVPLLGREAVFSEPTSSRVYRGTGYMLEMAAGAASEAFISHGAANNGPNLTGDLTLETWLWVNAFGTSSFNYWGWIPTSGNYPFRLELTQAGALSLNGNSGGVLYTATYSGTLSSLRPYHVAVRISGRDVVFVVWDDDAQTETIDTHTNVFPAGARNGVTNSLYRTLRVVNGAALWGDDWRVWNVARTDAEIRAARSSPLPSVPASCVHYEPYDDGAGTSVSDNSASGFTGTITLGGGAGSAWLWSMEGGPELAGTPKPDLWGQRAGLRPVLVDPYRGAYQIAGGGALQEISATKEGGNPHTLLSEASNYRNFITAAGAPAAGESYPYKVRGLFLLGAAPTLPISANAKGYSASPGYSAATAAGIVKSIIQQRGPKLAGGDLDSSSFTALDSDDDSICGVALYGAEPISAALDFVAGSVGAWWGYVRASALFHVERFEGPAGSADYNFDRRTIVDLDEQPAQTVIYEVRVRFCRNDVVMTEDQVAASIVGSADWQALMQEWQEEVASDPTLRATYPGDASRSITVDTALQVRDDARAFASFLLSLLGGAKEAPTLTVRAPGRQVKAGQTCTVNYKNQNGTTRLGFDGTKRYAILAVRDLQQRGEVELELWG